MPITPVPSDGIQSVRDLIAYGGLQPHFQPIVDTASGRLFGHEALIRTPTECPWVHPDALFTAARFEGCLLDLELECFALALQHWARAHKRGWLFVNLSAEALVQAVMKDGLDRLLQRAKATGLPLSNIVVELTEHERVQDVSAIRNALVLLRKSGGSLALDDFGDGRSSLRLWSELRPEYVKIDKYFTHNVQSSSHKIQTLRAIQQLADNFGSKLVGEGVEHAEELLVLRDMGLHYVQGFFLGRPAAELSTEISPEALGVLESRQIAVLPEQVQVVYRGVTASSMMIKAPSLPSNVSHDAVAEFFNRHEDLHAVALCEEEVPVGLVGRSTIQGLYLRLYFRDLYGKRPCLMNANLTPLLVDIHTPIEKLTQVLTSADQRYLTDGYILTEGGLYRGLGTGEQLVRRVTEARIEAARHANPLTFLPGNVPISIHIERLLENAETFLACYADLNHFKAFNDHYGYWRGDQMIKLQAECLTSVCDPRRDFIGHVGGDDFVMLMQSPDGEARVQAAVDQFNERAKTLFDEEAQQAGGIHAEDRHGNMRFYPFTSLSVGTTRVEPIQFHSAEEVASAAAMAKHHAKQQQLGVFHMARPLSPELSILG